MCPPHSIPSNNRELHDEVYLNWIHTARCCIALFFQHRVTNQIICDECQSDLPPYEETDYDRVSRHYIHISGPAQAPQIELCHTCRRPIPFSRIPSLCPVCHDVLDDFLRYLQHANDRPFDSNEATIIAINQTRNLPTAG